ncbi:putative sugar O-methyltransferase [Methylobacterium sp. R2-1]|uniref:putative sugar O-methyltransferase n=1 Tax=Methylobacterium sp. R2-1 TaxID=2587064 RepID=UPI001620447D|nr:putative sugar O-methyltransferase [Methylobacterium sp. R2-1]
MAHRLPSLGAGLRWLKRKPGERHLGRLPPDFASELYLDLNADVAMAVEAGHIASAQEHYRVFGRREGRPYRAPTASAELGGGIAGPWTYRYPYRAWPDLPAIAFAAPCPGAEDETIARRLIAAWRSGAGRSPVQADSEGMWAARTQGFPAFHRALRDGDAGVLSDLLNNLFQSHLAHGIAMGRTMATLARHAPTPFAASWCDRLLRLSEALGLAHVRSPEQGDFAAPLGPLAHHVEPPRLEAELGFPLTFPDVGAPFGVPFGAGILPEHAFSHAYAAWRIGQLGDLSRVVEIGGGFGGLAWFMRGTGRRYTILDLPFTNVLQGWFLLKAGLDVSLAGEAEAAIRVLPWWEIERDESYDLAVNQDSLPEMPPETAAMYIARIRAIAPLFYSINQEAAAPNTDVFRQVVVPELVARDGGYRRLNRNLFWLRDGYVEEIYARR